MSASGSSFSGRILNGTVAANSPYVSAEELLKTVQPADLIEFSRGAFQHWAMYSEKPGYVYNVPAEGKGTSQVKITLELLVDVARNNPDPKKQSVRVNNKKHSAIFKFSKPRPPSEALAAARKMYESGKYYPYEFMGRNCEYYCTLCKFGHGWSDQVPGPTSHGQPGIEIPISSCSKIN